MARLRMGLTAAVAVALAAVVSTASPAAASTARPVTSHLHHSLVIHSNGHQTRMRPANMPTEGS